MTSDALARCREAIAAGHGRVPLVQSVVLDGDTAVTAFAKLHRGDHGFLLESLEGGERWARFTFLATEPAAVYRYRGRTVEQLQGGAWTPAATDVSPLDHLGALLRETTAPVREAWEAALEAEMAMAGTEHVRSVDPRYLAHPPREPDYRRGRAHDAFVTTLDAHVGGLAAETLEARLRATLDPFDS